MLQIIVEHRKNNQYTLNTRLEIPVIILFIILAYDGCMESSYVFISVTISIAHSHYCNHFQIHRKGHRLKRTHGLMPLHHKFFSLAFTPGTNRFTGRAIFLPHYPSIHGQVSYALTQRQDLQASACSSIIKCTQGPSTVRCLSFHKSSEVRRLSDHKSRPGTMCLNHKLFPVAVTPRTSRFAGLGIFLPISSIHGHHTTSLNGRIYKEPRYASLLTHVLESNHVTPSLNNHVSYASASQCLSFPRT